jgi:3-oxoacyl-(acyl-carrier-protein) synthase
VKNFSVLTPVAITSVASFSALGSDIETVWENYQNPTSLISEKQIGEHKELVCALPSDLAEIKSALASEKSKYRHLDDSVLYGILASRKAVKKAGWTENDVFGINIGSSRGATSLFEKYHKEFIETGKTSTQSSPSTTLGNISSWIAQDLKSKGPEISHSITCSTALHAILNGIVWINAGMTDKFLAGGSEAPLTPFTLAQMKAMKIYATCPSEYPCRSFDLQKTENTMVLGEGAAVLCLEKGSKENALGYITGVGYATETITHGSSISDEAESMQKAMKMALQNTHPNEVDAIVMHAPGTIKGDLSEFRAIEKVFGENLPLLTSNKWKIGHTFGASGALSIELALLMLQHQKFIGIPFVPSKKPVKPLQKILINAVGFGGNAVSILIEK